LRRKKKGRKSAPLLPALWRGEKGERTKKDRTRGIDPLIARKKKGDDRSGPMKEEGVLTGCLDPQGPGKSVDRGKRAKKKDAAISGPTKISGIIFRCLPRRSKRGRMRKKTRAATVGLLGGGDDLHPEPTRGEGRKDKGSKKDAKINAEAVR